MFFKMIKERRDTFKNNFNGQWLWHLYSLTFRHSKGKKETIKRRKS